MTDESYYEVLGVEPGATRDELRAAYRSRVEKLEAAREGKGVNEASLRANRDETARVRSAWNVLSDPFQRQRYDAQLAEPAASGVEVVDGGAEPGSEVALTGWRKLLAPPPPKQPRNGTSPAESGANPPWAGRPVPQPTVSLPAGVTLAETRTRGMAMLFDVSILLLIYIGAQFLLPGVIQSDYKSISDQISACNSVHDDAKTASKSDKKQCGINTDAARKAQEAAAQKQADKLSKDIQGTQYTTLAIIFVLFMLYLVPLTATSGRTLGMRRSGIRVIRVDGAPVGWFPAFARFAVPIAIALVVPTLGPVLGLGLVLWGFRDRNKQGIHDKLAKTLVVNG